MPHLVFDGSVPPAKRLGGNPAAEPVRAECAERDAKAAENPTGGEQRSAAVIHIVFHAAYVGRPAVPRNGSLE